ncbi:aminotransferase [Pochonia chlamydosporia 170]|uniref:Aminotransferase n=1 Tax=Pochonia chlamydosporia 170 TaxID=1380566 RepID=A0A179F4Q5_METCM|nr:aminotransferase [Pochonia chlamydosporia 170]OAQ60350.1 aminotransferase [Pochonia chlamydosporia 170]
MAPHRNDEADRGGRSKEDVHVSNSNEGHLLHRSLIDVPHFVKSASGIDLHLDNGETAIDACGGAAVAILGHGNEEVHTAIIKQLHQVSYVHTQAYTTSVAEELANVILKGNPYGLEKAFFVSSGSEAVDSAMKLARQYHYERNDCQRLHFVSRNQSYHGNTIGAMSLSGNVSRKIPYLGFGYPHVSHVNPPYAYRYQRPGETELEFTKRLLMELEEEFLRLGPQTIVAFIAETVIGATAGCVPPPSGYFRGVREICDKYGILLILDEIMCGTGRTGTYFAFEQEDVVPDIVTAAKGLGGGYAAIAGIYIHKKIIDQLRLGSNAFVHGHTYQAHPVSCAAALAVQRILRRDGLVERCKIMGELLGQKLRKELRDCKFIGDIRGRGLFWAIEFVKDRNEGTKEPFDPSIKFGYKVQEAAFQLGVAIYPGSGTIDGLKGDHILLAPPFTVTEDQLGRICQVVREAIEDQGRAY